MGKNRPPRKVRELLVQLEQRRSELAALSDKAIAAKVQQLEHFIACKPEDFEGFETAAEALLQETEALGQSARDLPADDGFWEGPAVTPDKAEAWKSVCGVRTEMHSVLRAEAAESGVVANRWRRHKQGRQEDENQENRDPAACQDVRKEKAKDANSSPCRQQPLRDVPIVPKVSLAFADKASAGHRKFALPDAHQQQSPAPLAAARPQKKDGVLVWIRHYDLRIHDNPVLTYAASLNCPVHLVFAWSEEEDACLGKWRIGGSAASLWLHHALDSLDADYHRQYGQRINFVFGKATADALCRAAREAGANCVVTGKGYDVVSRHLDGEVKSALDADGVKLVSFNTFLLNDIDSVRLDMSERRGAFGTLVPFLFACNSQPSPTKPEAPPSKLLKPASMLPGSTSLRDLGICKLPIRKDGSVVDWAAPICEAWEITELAGWKALRSFLAPSGGLSRYETDRHLADASAVARISPYLRFGMLSCRTAYWEAKAAKANEVAKTFWRRFVWRDLAYWQLRLFPHMTDQPLRAHYEGQVWNTDKAALDRWRKGRTGYPLVDAGMRELWATGWMTQNVRMVAALFLTEYLNIHWIEGALWFHHTLVDADPAINPMMWQNAGKSGLDQWNFTMHPAEFGRRMDPTGDYVRKWCPELRSLPARFIHCPWEAPDRLQKHVPSGGYPDAMIYDLDAAAWASVKAIREQRAKHRDRNDENGYDLIVLPRGSTLAHDGKLMRLFTKKDYRLPLQARAYDDERMQTGGYQAEKRHPSGEQWTLADYAMKRR
eukprot:TRINITY_DN30416_c0_g1_i2.p1 TRINITY_DN30416_c0_g1~~TRINITY_DN30416_c0_g1_i2.p1  ORF type:complete len:777 (+),score=112.24 TRINITY_DN30416_c0_g1_i2:61-2391(+)